MKDELVEEEDSWRYLEYLAYLSNEYSQAKEKPEKIFSFSSRPSLVCVSFA